MKKSFFAALLLSVCCNILSYNIDYINVSLIQNAQSYGKDIDFLYEHKQFLSAYVPDEYWQAPLSRSEYKKKLRLIYKTICEYPEKNNQDYLLLKAMVAEYLYHLDDREFYEKAVQGYNEVAQLERADYRCNWFLGTFYARALQPFESIKQFDFIFEQVPDKKINPACIAECAYAESLAFMKKWAIADFTEYHKRSGTKAEENILLQDLKKNFIDYDGKSDIEFDRLFQVGYREEGKGLFSRLLGLWIPVPKDSEVSWQGLQDGATEIQVTLFAFDKKTNSNVPYNISIFSILSKSIPVKKFLKSLGKTRKVNIGFPKRYKTYECSELQENSEEGNTRGLVTIVKAPYKSSCELDIEEPFIPAERINNSEQKMFPHETEYNRYKDRITHFILLESYGDIYPESAERYFDFVTAMRIE